MTVEAEETVVTEETVETEDCGDCGAVKIVETVETVETVYTEDPKKVSLTYSVTDNLKARDASASKNCPLKE